MKEGERERERERGRGVCETFEIEKKERHTSLNSSSEITRQLDRKVAKRRGRSWEGRGRESEERWAIAATDAERLATDSRVVTSSLSKWFTK